MTVYPSHFFMFSSPCVLRVSYARNHERMQGPFFVMSCVLFIIFIIVMHSLVVASLELMHSSRA